VVTFAARRGVEVGAASGDGRAGSNEKVVWVVSMTVKQAAKPKKYGRKIKTPLETLVAAWTRASTAEKIAFLRWVDEVDLANNC
jgi:hypothetical protein